MLKAKIISALLRFVFGATALGIGIWYVSSSIGGASITYSSLDKFLGAVGVQNGDIASANGCFLCGYIEKLFSVIGKATESFWTAMIDNIWLLMAIGFGIYLFITALQHLWTTSKKNATLDESEKTIEFGSWFNKIWRTGLRVIIAGVILGVLGFGGHAALRAVTNITITPVMLVGSELSMAATGISSSAQCGTTAQNDDVLNPVMKPFMCVMGNLNTVMLAGAAGGFALMNYAWIGDMGGGAFTWVAGLALVIMFLIIGFGLFFDVLSVLFKLIFLIIFLPLIIAAWAFEGTWKIATGVANRCMGMLVESAIKIVKITLQILIIYATVSFAADEYFPGPNDGYNAILPPIMGVSPQNADARTMSVINVFSECERVALTNGEMDKTKFKNCFTAQRATVERRYPGAFDFMKDGFEFLMIMIGLFLLYYYAIAPKVDGLLGKVGKEEFDYGGWVKELGTRAWQAPVKFYEQIAKSQQKT